MENSKKSLDFIYKESKEQLDFAFNWTDSMDSKNVTILSINAVILTVIIGILLKPNLNLNTINKVFIITSVFFLFSSFLFFLLAFLLVRYFPVAPELNRLYKKYLNEPQERTKLLVTQAIIKSWTETKNQNKKRANFIRKGTWFFFLGIIMIGLYFFNILSDNWIIFSIIILALFIIFIYIVIKIKKGGITNGK